MKKIINKKNALYIIFSVIIILLISILGFLKVKNLYTNINEQSILNNSNEVNNDESINEQNKPNVSLDNTTGNLCNKQELKNDTSNKVNKNNKNNNVVNNLNKEDESNNNITNDSNKEDESNNSITNDSNKEDESNNSITNDLNKEDELNNNTTNDSNKEDESNNNATNDSNKEDNSNSNTPTVEKCVFNGELKKGATYKDGTYTYKYNQTPYGGGMWNDISVIGGGWGVQLTDRKSTSKVTEAPCSEINGKPIVSMAYMFYQSQAETIDLSNFDTSNVVYMNDMFRSSKATILNLSTFNTSKVEDMTWMFYLSNAKTIDLSGDFHIRKSTWKDYIFLDSKVETIYVSNQKESDIVKGYIVQGHNVEILIK